MPGSSTFNVYLWHVCYLFHKLSREKPREKWNFDLLRFSHLTLPIYAGIECPNIKQVQKQQIWAKASSPWRAKGELNGEDFQRAPGHFATEMAMARNFARRSSGEAKGEERRFDLIFGDVAESHWWRKLSSPWRAIFCQAKLTFADLYKSSFSLISNY